MGEIVGPWIATAFFGGCIVIAFYELVRWAQPEITLDKLVAAGICALWYIAACAFAGTQGIFMGIFLLIPLGLIWFGDELGSVTGLKYGLVQRASSGIVVRAFGWFLLFARAAYVIYAWTLRRTP